MTRRRPNRTGIRRPGFTLVEAVVVVLLLGVSVPPALSLMSSAADGRADAVNAHRATVLASAVLEQTMADAASSAEGLGRQSLGDPGYPTALASRLEPVTESFAAVGLAWAMDVGPLVGPLGEPTGDAARDGFRVLTVRVSFPLARGGRTEMPVSALLATEDAP